MANIDDPSIPKKEENKIEQTFGKPELQPAVLEIPHHDSLVEKPKEKEIAVEFVENKEVEVIVPKIEDQP